MRRKSNFCLVHEPSNVVDIGRHHRKNQHQHQHQQLSPGSSSTCSNDRDHKKMNVNACPDTVDFGMSTLPQTLSSHAASYSQPIDNTTLPYIAVLLPCGIETRCAPDVLSGYPMVLRSLETDMQNIFKLLPWSVHELLRRTKIWVNTTYSHGPRDDPKVLRHQTVHHHEDWLIQV
jgi:hypothetical protein